MDFLREIALKTADLIKRSGKTLALTGAGISTESGIPDYRSKGTGLWEKYDPMSKASLSALISDPVEFYNFNLPRWIKYANAEPNTAHRVLAKMEEKNFIRGVITQNIDGLHIKAGSRNVWEVHGHLRTCRCMGCNHKYDFSEAVRQFEDGIVPPKCKTCGGILRPDVVLFEDPMSSDYYRALEALEGCELLIVVGSSLQVYPVADMPYLARQMVIINKEPTTFDSRAAVTAHCKAGEFFEELASILKI
ncbi:MAG: NAD-dependent deacetylase [Thermoanaerobacteraceae bacterium]|uniref:protein acetyllysine N-acetyltransferase n=1 Tax=Biomaibacter acetigenes TaxID=2316383 RepID=A0A3G2R6H0_9FIRM|nr:NAD-dependent deacylase [Biomaibacter acetigenes]AYO30447.1 NAD-dependent deacylase [Biomaibacter acetigenes]MDK2877446.1 NAD-dependent deacetylase [Thermoanaerobacteraceae bacterium]